MVSFLVDLWRASLLKKHFQQTFKSFFSLLPAVFMVPFCISGGYKYFTRPGWWKRQPFDHLAIWPFCGF